jgi:hypothetical protein
LYNQSFFLFAGINITPIADDEDEYPVPARPDVKNPSSAKIIKQLHYFLLGLAGNEVTIRAKTYKSNEVDNEILMAYNRYVNLFLDGHLKQYSMITYPSSIDKACLYYSTTGIG